MIYLFIFGALLILFTLWVTTVFIPALPLFPIVWTSVMFLIFAELLFLVAAGMVLRHKSIRNTPVSAAFLPFPLLYVLCSAAVIPYSFTFTSFNPLLLIHFVAFLALVGLGFAMLATAENNQAETKERSEKRAAIRVMSSRLARCISDLKHHGAEYVTPKMSLTAEHLKYAPESSDSTGCLQADAAIDEIISQIEACVADFSSDPKGNAQKISRLFHTLDKEMETRKAKLI